MTSDTTYTRLEDLGSARYVFVTPAYFRTMGIALRAGRSFTEEDADAVRAQIRAADPEQPIQALRTMDTALAASLDQPRFSALLLSLFAALAVALAVVGIYGVVSHAVSQRTGEIGIRLALGASPRSIRRLVVGQSVRLAAAGIAAGTILTAGASRVLQGLLFGVTPGDPLTFAAAAGGLLVVATLASWIPARRAMKLDPMTALRSE